jgi:outer membrane autotransporter protein
MRMKRVGNLKRFWPKESFPVKGKDIMLSKWKPIQFLVLILLFFNLMAPSFASGQVNLYFDQTNISVNENAGTVTVGYTLKGPSECWYGNYSWTVVTQNGSAVSGIDYQFKSQFDEWDGQYDPDPPAIDYVGSIEIPIINNCLVDSSRIFYVVFENVSSDPYSCEIVPGSRVTVEIIDDDIPLATVPASLQNLTGEPGETVEGSFSVSGGLPPYQGVSENKDFLMVQNGNIVSYRYLIPSSTNRGQKINFDIEIYDSCTDDRGPNSIVVPVTITVGENFNVSATQVNLTGFQGQQARGSVTISGGDPPFSAIVSDGPGEVSVSDSTVIYSLKVPADAQDGQNFKGTVIVSDARENSINVQFETTVKPFTPLTGNLSLTRNQRQVAGTMEKIYPLLNELQNPTPGQGQLAQRLNALIENAQTDPNGVENAIAQITPDEAGTQATLTTKTAVQQMSNVMNRLTALRAGATGFNTSGLSFGIPGETYLAGLVTDVVASGVLGSENGLKNIELIKNLGVFMTGRFNFGSRDTTKNQSGFDFDTLGVTAGIDYRFTRDLLLGIAMGYADTAIDYSRNGGDLDIDAWSASLYGNYYILENLYLDAIVNLGWNDYKQTRKVVYSVPNDIPIASNQKSDYSGDQYSVSVGVGYEFNFNAFKVDLNGRLGYIELKVDDYKEKDPNNTGLNLYIRDQETDSFTTTLGVQISYTFNTDIGVFIPKMSAEWEHEFGDDSFLIEGSFINDPNPSNPSVFFIKTDDPSRDYFRLSPGVTMVFPHGISSFINFDCLVGYSDFESYNLSLGMRFEF